MKPDYSVEKPLNCPQATFPERVGAGILGFVSPGLEFRPGFEKLVGVVAIAVGALVVGEASYILIHAQNGA